MAALVGFVTLALCTVGLFAVLLVLVVPVAFGGLWLQRHREARHAVAPAQRLTLVRSTTDEQQVRAA